MHIYTEGQAWNIHKSIALNMQNLEVLPKSITDSVSTKDINKHITTILICIILAGTELKRKKKILWVEKFNFPCDLNDFKS